ncbi:MAG: cyclic pyranopterin monophosphate synthase MoaC [Acidobacteria bacterium]|nr:cyclic pyranopterin monophosphate synthase MoaC [Acidobacteriota bacterium]
MVDISGKRPTERRAVAECFVRLAPPTLAAIAAGQLPKGDAIETACLAGIMGAKRTGELIPMSHPLALAHAAVQAEVCVGRVCFEAAPACIGPTGLEMEALAAAAVVPLTLFDMVKAVEKCCHRKSPAREEDEIAAIILARSGEPAS